MARQSNRIQDGQSSDITRFLALCLSVLLLSVAAHLVLAFATAATMGQLAWRLSLFAVGGGLFIFLIGTAFGGSGASGALGMLVVFVVLMLLAATIAVLLGVTVWPDASQLLHERAQWIFVGLQSFYLFLVLETK
jgi:hypothetical protein